MDTESHLIQTLNLAISRLLKPLFRVLLRHNMSFGAFEELAKRAYVDVAIREFGIPGKKPSISRTAILSGMTRKEVQRLVSLPDDAPPGAGEQYNRAARVLTAWARDPDFLDSQGRPKPLSAQDGECSFAELVKRHSGDVPPRAVLDELIHVGAVRRADDKHIELVARAYVPQRSAVDKLDILGMDVGDLITTIGHNIEHGTADPRFQRKVMYQRMPVSVLPEFRKLSASQAQALLEELDRWLAAHVNGGTDGAFGGERAGAVKQVPRVRVGMGVFYFEEQLADEPAQER